MADSAEPGPGFWLLKSGLDLGIAKLSPGAPGSEPSWAPGLSNQALTLALMNLAQDPLT